MEEKKDKVYRGQLKMILDNFLGGIAWSFGMWIGTTVILILSFYFLSKINFVPIIGDFVSQVSKDAASKTSPFPF